MNGNSTDYTLKTKLTQREIEVLQSLADFAYDAAPYRSIAEKFVISETTVKTHVNNIFQKLGVNNKTAAIFEGIKKQIVSAGLPTCYPDSPVANSRTIIFIY